MSNHNNGKSSGVSHPLLSDSFYGHVQRNQTVYSAVAGAASGAVVKTAMAPLERVKILIQLSGMSAALKGLPTDSGIVRVLMHILRSEGIYGLFKGNWANVVRVMPVYALKFSFNDRIRNLVKSKEQQRTADLSFNQLLAAGTLAGLSQILVTYPLELIRTRVTLSSITAEGAYGGIIDCAVQTVRREGFFSLYKGLVASLWSGPPYVGIQMTCYEMCKRQLPAHPWLLQVLPHRSDPSKQQQEATVAGKMLAGAMSGLVAQTLTFPGDTVRRRMQSNGLMGKPKLYENTTDCVKKIWQKEGMKGFFKGAMTNVVRSLPAAALQFTIYDFFKSQFGIAPD